MHIFKLVSFTFLSTAAALVIDGQSGAPNGDIYKRQGGDPDFSGTGNIFVVPGKNIQTANPNHRVGCITAQGGFVSGTSNCGVFTVQTGQPFRSTAGTCSFSDPTAPVGRPQAPQGYAFKCSSSTPAGSAFYSLVSVSAWPFGILVGGHSCRSRISQMIQVPVWLGSGRAI